MLLLHKIIKKVEAFLSFFSIKKKYIFEDTQIISNELVKQKQQEVNFQHYPICLKSKVVAHNSTIEYNRNGKIGASEDMLFKLLLHEIPKVVANNTSIFLNGVNLEPDIAIIDNQNNIFIDIEIDEPYTIGKEGLIPIHYRGLDNKRNLAFLNNGWSIIRFSEEQVFKYTKDVVLTILDFYFDINTQKKLTKIATWTKSEAILMIENKYRDSYLPYKYEQSSLHDRKKFINHYRIKGEQNQHNTTYLTILRELTNSEEIIKIENLIINNYKAKHRTNSLTGYVIILKSYNLKQANLIKPYEIIDIFSETKREIPNTETKQIKNANEILEKRHIPTDTNKLLFERKIYYSTDKLITNKFITFSKSYFRITEILELPAKDEYTLLLILKQDEKYVNYHIKKKEFNEYFIIFLQSILKDEFEIFYYYLLSTGIKFPSILKKFCADIKLSCDGYILSKDDYSFLFIDSNTASKKIFSSDENSDLAKKIVNLYFSFEETFNDNVKNNILLYHISKSFSTKSKVSRYQFIINKLYIEKRQILIKVKQDAQKYELVVQKNIFERRLSSILFRYFELKFEKTISQLLKHEITPLTIFEKISPIIILKCRGTSYSFKSISRLFFYTEHYYLHVNKLIDKKKFQELKLFIERYYLYEIQKKKL